MNHKNFASIFILLAAFTLLTASIPAQDVAMIQNPAKPAIKDAGRVLALKEVMRVTDEEGDFYFKSPGRLKIASDGSIYVTDGGRLLKFDASGKYLVNFQKKGEGPGEFVRLYNYFLSDDSVIVYAQQPAKVIDFDISGKFKKERKMKRRMAFHRPLIYDKGNFWSLRGDSLNIAKMKTGYFSSNLTLCLERPNDKTKKTSLVFTGKAYMVRQMLKGGRIQIWMDSLVPVMTAQDPANKFIYVTSSQSYKIQKVSLEKQKIMSTFNRKYRSIAYEEPEEEEGARTLDQPSPDYFNDTMRIYFHDNKLWVFTSTIDKEKGVLVDIFSPEGRFIDQFYLPLPQVKSPHHLDRFALTHHKNFLFVIEKDEDDTPYIVKYQYQL